MNEFRAAKSTSQPDDDGRIDGKHRCPWCGMRSNSRAEAVECCKELGTVWRRLPDARFNVGNKS